MVIEMESQEMTFNSGAELDGKILKLRYVEESDLKDKERQYGNNSNNTPIIRKKIFKPSRGNFTNDNQKVE